MSASRRRSTTRVLERIALLGASPTDGDEVLAQKATLTIASLVVTGLSVVWVGTYLALGLPVSAAIPATYQVVTVVSLAVFARSRSLGPFRRSQLLLMLVLPFLLQWSLGGYAASSLVSLWALISAFGALFLSRPSSAIPWFAGFIALVLLSGIIDPILARQPAPIPDTLQTAFFVLNTAGVALTAYLMLQYAVRARDAAIRRSDGLLLNILPPPIAERLKHEPGTIAEHHAEVTVLFADVVDFTPFMEHTPPERVVQVLDDIFTAFDRLAEQHGLEKIKTVGDAYMAVAGLPVARPDHAEAAADMALDMLADLAERCPRLGLDLSIRVGMDSGPVIAGVIGRRTFAYDLWGDVVNTASRMESHGVPGRIQVTQATYERLRGAYRFEARGGIEVKGKGVLPAWLLLGRRGSDASQDPAPGTLPGR